MGSYSEFIQRVKDRVRIEDVIRDVMGFTLVRNGRAWRTREHPSLTIYPDTQRYQWFSKGGAADGGAGGDVVQFLQSWGGMPDLRDAVEYLAQRAGIQFEYSPEENARYQAARERSDRLTTIAEWLHQRLLQTPAAVRYCEKRGWTLGTVEEPGSIRQARLGYWNGDRRALLDHLKMHGYDGSHNVCVAVGNMPAGMLVYTHWDRRRCVYLSTRSIEGKRHWNPPNDLMGQRQPYWNWAHSPVSDLVVVVEGQADAITLAQWGIGAVALAGCQADDQLVEAMQRHDRIYVGLDSDDSGLAGADALADRLGPAVRMVTWPGSGDANDWLQRGGTADACERLLVQAPPHALWLANRVMVGPRLELEDRLRRVYERLASLKTKEPYQYQRIEMDAARALDERVSDMRRTVRAVAAERSRSATEAPTRDGPALEQNRLDRFTDDLPEHLKQELLAQSKDHEGHARSVHALYGERIAYVPQWGWVAYNGRYWDREGAEHLVQGYVVEALKRRRHLAVAAEVEQLVKVTACSWRNVASVQKMLEKLALRSVGDFDSSPDMLNVANGVVDLRTGELMPHDPSHLFMYMVPVEYHADADSSEWQLFLISTFGYEDQHGMVHVDTELLDYVQMCVGYSITGHTRENILFYLYGPTRSGKGTFQQTLQKLLGQPLAMSVDFHVLTSQRNEDSQNFALAPFKPCRMLAGSEPGKYERFNEAKMKMLTGDDPVRASFKQRDHFEYRPQFKIWLSANWEFNADPVDQAAWGRVRILHTPNSYLGREDKGLKHRLQSRQNLQGVLAWAVEGARRWYALGSDGLRTPAAVQSVADDQRKSQDFLGAFLEECTTEAADAFTPVRALYIEYQGWAKDMGVTAMKSKAFSQGLKAKGFESARQRVAGKLARGYVGIGLLEPQTAQPALFNN